MFAKIGGGEEEDEVDADRGVAGTQEAERVVGRGHTEDWLGDFSEQPEETSESDDDDYFLGDVQEHYEDIFGTDQGEAPSVSLHVYEYTTLYHCLSGVLPSHATHDRNVSIISL